MVKGAGSPKGSGYSGGQPASGPGAPRDSPSGGGGACGKGDKGGDKGGGKAGGGKGGKGVAPWSFVPLCGEADPLGLWDLSQKVKDEWIDERHGGRPPKEKFSDRCQSRISNRCPYIGLQILISASCFGSAQCGSNSEGCQVHVQMAVLGTCSDEAENGRASELSLSPLANLPMASWYPSFYYAGFCNLLPWNMVLTFTYSFDCDWLGGRTFAGSGWGFWCPLVYSLALNIAQAVMSARRIRERIPYVLRWSVASMGLTLGMLAILLCRLSTSEKDAGTGFLLALLAASVLGLASGTYSSSSFGLAAAISPELVHAAMIGGGLSGLAACFVGFAGGGAESWLVASFVFSALCTLGGIPLYLLVTRKNPHVAAMLEEAARAKQLDAVQRSRGISLQGQELALRPAGGPDGDESPILSRSRSSADIFKFSAWPQCLTVCCVFTVTFIVFPGVVSRWVPGERVSYLIATFQIMDILGRYAPKIPCMQITNGRTVSFLSLLRLVFVPAFIVLQRHSDQVWAEQAVLQYGLMVAFAFSNGYVSTLSMMLGPSQRGLSQDEQESAGAMMSFFLVFGIFFGSLLAMPTQIGVSSAQSCSAVAVA
ncbi:unnamed protein product [Polarella glacialis]|uniref:Uncharacterized protein n=1 Tax=Polarella glacialis TaxID=89957 RepID=A0A813D3W0_POLGL|nr:unnamed protein product [Polarella glacialis]